MPVDAQARRFSFPLDTPGAHLSSGFRLECGLAVCPGGVFVVDSAVRETAVEDADKAIAEGAEGLVVEIALGPPLVVEGSATRTVADRAEGPLVDGVSESPVPNVAGHHDPFGARGSG